MLPTIILLFELQLTNIIGRAHNPEGNGSKPFSATIFFLFFQHLSSQSCFLMVVRNEFLLLLLFNSDKMLSDVILEEAANDPRWLLDSNDLL